MIRAAGQATPLWAVELQLAALVFPGRHGRWHQGSASGLHAPEQLEAPVSLLILGDTQAHLRLAGILDGNVAASTLTREVAVEWLAFATKVYSENAALAREEAIRSCSLAAMTLMLSAHHRGFGTCPVGFNAPDLAKLVGLSRRYIPVIWITLGKAAQPVSRRKPRRPVSEVFMVDASPI